MLFSKICKWKPPSSSVVVSTRNFLKDILWNSLYSCWSACIEMYPLGYYCTLSDDEPMKSERKTMAPYQTACYAGSTQNGIWSSVSPPSGRITSLVLSHKLYIQLVSHWTMKDKPVTLGDRLRKCLNDSSWTSIQPDGAYAHSMSGDLEVVFHS